MPRKQTPITKSARNEQCQVMIYGVCNSDPETVVLAHLNGGGGGMKNPESCKYWGPERRQADQPLDFPCRRKKQGNENA